MAANKVKFNLKNVHYAKLTLDGNGIPSYATPVAIPGAVTLTMDAQGDITKFYADGIEYWVNSVNNGYEGSLELALVPDHFKKDILNEELDSNGVLAEYAANDTNEFALLFEFDGDQKARRHVFYRCKATRPQVSGETDTETRTPQTETLNLTASRIPNGKNLVKASTSDTTGTSTYNGWYSAVYLPSNSGAIVTIEGGDTVAAGSTLALTGTAVPSGTINWSSNDEAVATVEDGVVTGVAAGTCVIMATLASNASVYDVKTITVTATAG